MKLKKVLTIIGASLAGIVVAGAITAFTTRDAFIDQAIRNQLTEEGDNTLLANDGKIRVLLCGTGTPEISAARAQSCTLVAAGGRLFLFDAGEGATKSLAGSGVPITGIDDVFLTHYHSDHYNGLATLVNSAWIWGRTTPIDVTGPAGLDGILEGLGSAYELDREYRSDHMLGDTVAASSAVGHEIAFADHKATVRVYDQDGVTIDAQLVHHDPVEPAVGYVVRYNGKKVFISGDTEIVDSNIPALQNADLVVHEAYATHLIERALPIMRELGQEHDADVAERTLSYHADTIALAQQAEAAGVKHLALTHMTPYPNNAFARILFVEGMADHYHGTLTLGQDGTLIVL